jgi:transcriptional regulator with XRE-family HTH domain
MAMKEVSYPAGGGAGEASWGTLVKRFRNDTGLTQAALAEILSIDPTTISRWERGRERPNLALQRRLRALIEPDALNLRLLMDLMSAFVLHDEGLNTDALRQLLRSEINRWKRETYCVQGQS